MELDDPVRLEVLQGVYRHVLNHRVRPGHTAAELATELGLTCEEAESAVKDLLAFRLLRDTTDGALVAVAPDQVDIETLGPLERTMRGLRDHIDTTRKQLMAFMPDYEASLPARRSSSQFQVLESLTEVRLVIADLTDQCQDEILTAQPGGGRDESVLEEAAPRDEATLRRGVRMKILYQHTARFSQGTKTYVDRVTRLGAQVRTLDDRFTRSLIFDRKVALIAVPENPLAAVLIREPHVVAFITGTHERLWLAAEPFALSSGNQEKITDDLRQSILRLLTGGMTDASIAARLGMSVRTCRRHIADVMAELGAQSRFQAGYRLAAKERAQP